MLLTSPKQQLFVLLTTIIQIIIINFFQITFVLLHGTKKLKQW